MMITVDGIPSQALRTDPIHRRIIEIFDDVRCDGEGRICRCWGKTQMAFSSDFPYAEFMQEWMGSHFDPELDIDGMIF